MRGVQENSPVVEGEEGGNMRRPLNLILVIILLMACSGCFFYDRGHSSSDSGDNPEREGYGEYNPRKERQ